MCLPESIFKKIIYYLIELEDNNICQHLKLVDKKWNKLYQEVISELKEEILIKLNRLEFKEEEESDCQEDEESDFQEDEESDCQEDEKSGRKYSLIRKSGSYDNYVNLVCINNELFVLYSGYGEREFRNFVKVELYYLAYKHKFVIFTPEITNKFNRMVDSNNNLKFKSFVYASSSTKKEALIIESIILLLPSQYRINMTQTSIKIKENLSDKEIKLFRQFYQSLIYNKSLKEDLISFEENYNHLYKPFITPSTASKLTNLGFLTYHIQTYRTVLSRLSPDVFEGIENMNFIHKFTPAMLRKIGISKHSFSDFLTTYRKIHKITVMVTMCFSLDYLYDNYIYNNLHLLRKNQKSENEDILRLKKESNLIVLKELGINGYFNVKSFGKNPNRHVSDRIRLAKKRIRELIAFLEELEENALEEELSYRRYQLDSLPDTINQDSSPDATNQDSSSDATNQDLKRSINNQSIVHHLPQQLDRIPDDLKDDDSEDKNNQQQQQVLNFLNNIAELNDLIKSSTSTIEIKKYLERDCNDKELVSVSLFIKNLINRIKKKVITYFNKSFTTYS